MCVGRSGVYLPLTDLELTGLHPSLLSAVELGLSSQQAGALGHGEQDIRKLTILSGGGSTVLCVIQG